MDNTKAMHWYDKSAKKGHYLSQISLADLLLKQSKRKDDANEYKQKAKVLIQKVFESKSSPKFIREEAEDLWKKYRLGDLLVE
jgi:TPR repeat protein